MTMARKTVVDEGVSGVYHCVSRCVRRAFLCGLDAYTGRDYEHRKGWIRDRVRELSGVFAVDVLAYAVMSNHLHLVLRTAPEAAHAWSAEEVAERWFRLFPVERDPSGNPLPVGELVLKAFCEDESRVSACRERLGSLSWFMRCVNEAIARRANREDECTGRFWEGRFKCQRLVDNAAILACMAYVDLNPVRAQLAESPEHSEFTSVYDRLVARQARERFAQAPEAPSPQQQALLETERAKAKQDAWLRGFGEAATPAIFSDIDVDMYLKLLDWTGRRVKEGKQGRIPSELLPVMQRLELDTEHWVENVQHYGSLFHRFAGRLEQLATLAVEKGQRWFHGKCKGGCLYARPLAEG